MTKIAIESIIRRPGGSRVTIGTESYHFKPQPDGAHVCEVTNSKHISRLLGISEGYRVYDPDLVEDETEDTPPAPFEPVDENSFGQPMIAEPDMGAALPDAEPTADPGEPTADPVDVPDALPALDGISRADLEAAFLREVGRVAHARAKDETLIAQIVAVRMEKAAGGEA